MASKAVRTRAAKAWCSATERPILRPELHLTGALRARKNSDRAEPHRHDEHETADGQKGSRVLDKIVHNILLILLCTYFVLLLFMRQGAAVLARNARPFW